MPRSQRTKKLPSVMGKRFDKVPQAKIARSSFNRSHGHKTTFDAGYLIPVFVDEALPGDTFSLRMNAFARLATPIKPLMDNMYMDSFFFAVPYRLVWENWHKFMGEQESPGDSTDFTIPQANVPANGYELLSTEDYMGLPTEISAGYSHSALPIRAFRLIWNEWFRDQNLQTPLTFSKGDGPDLPGTGGTALQRRGKRHDYFTGCLPWPQKGEEVTIPLGDTAPVIGDSATAIPQFRDAATGDTGPLRTGASGLNPPVEMAGGDSWQPNQNLAWSDPQLMADLSTATATTINALRQAFQIQKLLERDARGGTRYTEIIKSHFGVTSPDARLQRPEYLGGGSAPVIISPVAQTGGTDTGGQQDVDTPQANLAGVGTVNIGGHGFVKSFTEHCILIGMVSVRADLTYQQGLERMWSRETRYDFYWPVFAGLGEQAVLNKEIFLDGSAADDDVFGYQERHAEYRYKPSKITGKFRSKPVDTLDIWHLSQEFASLPTLSATFIEENPPVARVIAVDTEPHFLFDSYFQLTCARPMPVYGVPGLIDHF